MRRARCRLAAEGLRPCPLVTWWRQPRNRQRRRVIPRIRYWSCYPLPSASPGSDDVTARARPLLAALHLDQRHLRHRAATWRAAVAVVVRTIALGAVRLLAGARLALCPHALLRNLLGL